MSRNLASPIRIQPSRTSADRTKQSSIRPTENQVATSNVLESQQPESAHASEQHATHQRFVLPDPVAFRYLEEDPSTKVLARREKLHGYDCYVVEQWACSRTHPTFVITTFSSDPSHTIIVSILSVPTNEESWSPRLKVYFKALSQYARRLETPLGTLMITNLSGFPSSLTVIPVPEGDVKNHREEFFVNENLKRLRCSGRVGLTLGKPTDATKAKFYQLYQASDKIPFNSAVIELVKLCQVALMLFGKLEAEYADGLLCDVTEQAITDWWVEFGTEFYNVEPHDGILGPTTVAALLGMLSGARNRLNACGAPISKDVFDVESTKRAIAHFQKSHRIPKTRRLDQITLNRLHRATAKAASGEGWNVPRAVKSTVAELGGKGGEMVMDMVGGRQKAGIAEVETADIDQFIQLIHGARSKWLWQGKPRKQTSGDLLTCDDGIVFQPTEDGGYEWSSRRKGAFLEPSPTLRDSAVAEAAERRTTDYDKDRNRLLKKFPDKAPTHRTHDSNRGLGRLKDAVGLRGHSSKHSKDDKVDANNRTKSELLDSREYITPESASQLSRQPIYENIITDTPSHLEPSFFSNVEPPSDDEEHSSQQAGFPSDSALSRSPTASLAGSTYGGVDLDELFKGNDPLTHHLATTFRRNLSYSEGDGDSFEHHSDARWPRHLSFSIAEDSILTWNPIGEHVDFKQDSLLSKSKAPIQSMTSEELKRIAQKLSELETIDSAWVTNQINEIQGLDKQADYDQQELDHMFYPRLEEYRALQDDSQTLLDTERSQLTNALKEIEVLGAKLEYEIHTLRGRAEDVEDGVAEFERQVQIVEGRVAELEYEMRPKEGWLHWLIRLTTGIGKAPAATVARERRPRSR